jgi:glycosidase
MKKAIHLGLMLLLGFTLSCGKKQSKNEAITPSEKVADWMPKAIIYEVNLRHHTPEGTLAAFEKELDSLKELGINLLWFMPIQPIGIEKRKAKGDLFAADIADSIEREKYLGSPYSIMNYTDVNPDYGTLKEFKALVDQCHQKGFKVILDWVGNHTSWDHPWIKAHPDWYTKNKTGEITDPLNEKGESIGWTDVAELNYESKDLWKEMTAAMKFWVDECDVDGFRCDVAMNVPADFWEYAKKELEKSKPVFMLAESEEHDMRQFDTAFNAYYGWEMHHVMNEIYKGNKSPRYLDTLLQSKNKKFKSEVFAMNFITNHDENSWNGTEFERMGEAWKAMAVFAFTTPGMPLMYTGQEKGLKKRLRFFEKDTAVASGDFDYFGFYKALLAVRQSNEALWAKPDNKQITFIPTSNPNLLMYTRESGSNKLRVIINMSKETLKVTPNLPENAKYLIMDGYNRDKNTINPWGFVVVKY